MIPNVSFTRDDGNTGVVNPSAQGIFALVAPSEKGPLKPASFARVEDILATYGHGKLVEAAALHMTSGRPVICVRATASTDGAYSSFTTSSGGTATPAAGSTEPLDDFAVLIEFPVGGTLGTAGIQYRYSLDNGKTKSKLLALGTALDIVIPDTGITVTLGTATQTITAGRTTRFSTTGPQLTASDLDAPFLSLKETTLAFEAVEVITDADEDHIDASVLWTLECEAVGKFVRVLLNARKRADDETPADYQEDLAAIRAACSPNYRVDVGADGANVVSPIRKIRQFRPTALLFGARVARVGLSVDAAAVADGPLAGASIVDSQGNPERHDESRNPGLDDLGFITLRSINRMAGCFITNPKCFGPEGSDRVYDQHVRVENEEDLMVLEGIVQTAVLAELAPHVSAIQFRLSRTDDLGANTGAKITGFLDIVALSYAKQFGVTSRFVRTITAQAA